MHRQELLVCPMCSQAITAKSLRSYWFGGRIIYICKHCFLKLPEKDRANSKRQTKLRHEMKYTQTELPF